MTTKLSRFALLHRGVNTVKREGPILSSCGLLIAELWRRTREGSARCGDGEQTTPQLWRSLINFSSTFADAQLIRGVVSDRHLLVEIDCVVAKAKHESHRFHTYITMNIFCIGSLTVDAHGGMTTKAYQHTQQAIPSHGRERRVFFLQ